MKSNNKRTTGESKKRPGIRLRSPCDVKRLLNRTINQLVTDELHCGKARTIGYLSSILLKTFEVEELATRLERIEAFVKNK